MVDASESSRQSRWLVHSPDRSSVESIRSMPGVAGVEIETPSLEEIYIAYMRRRAPKSATGGVPVG